MLQCSSERVPATLLLARKVSERTLLSSTNHVTSISMLAGSSTSWRMGLQKKTISDWRLLVPWVRVTSFIFTVTKQVHHLYSVALKSWDLGRFRNLLEECIFFLFILTKEKDVRMRIQTFSYESGSLKECHGSGFLTNKFCNVR